MGEARPRYSGQISLGNVIQLVGMLAAVSAGYAVLRSDVSNNAEQIAKLGFLEVRVRSLETEAARADERFANILTFLARIDGRLERIERGAN